MPTEPGKLLCALRVAIGLGGWLAPNLTGKLFGLDPAGNPQMSFMARLFAAREFALVLSVTQTTGVSRRPMWMANIMCDALDTAAAYAAGRSGAIPKHAAVMSGATALAAVGLGVAALQAEE